MGGGNPCHHAVGGPKRPAAVEVQRVGEGLFELGRLEWAEARIVRRSVSCRAGAASAPRNPAVSRAAASCPPLAVTSPRR